MGAWKREGGRAGWGEGQEGKDGERDRKDGEGLHGGGGNRLECLF